MSCLFFLHCFMYFFYSFVLVHILLCIGVIVISLLELSWFYFVFFFFKQKTAYEMRISDWSSDVCSSDLHSLFPLRHGLSCLVHAGAGGVGQLLIQLAKARGATVYTTVGSKEKAEIAKARGADHVILYREENFREKLRELTGGAGVDVVYDSVGKDTIMDSMGSLKRPGHVCLYGASSGDRKSTRLNSSH